MRPGAPFDLAAIDAGSREGAPGDKADTTAATDALLDRTEELQERLWAEGTRSLLIVLQAMDAGGKDGALKQLYTAMNPQGVRIANFKVPTEEELGHDFLWRVHKVVPRRGEVVVFNRSHYEEVLVVRVHELVPESVWRSRYETIKEFERLLSAAGTRIVKLFLHISEEEQAERFRARLADPTKRWKFRLGDLDDRARWSEFMAAYAEAIERTSTDEAPWFAIPADLKWYRDWAVTTILLDTLADLDPRYPVVPDEELTTAMQRLGPAPEARPAPPSSPGE